ncbi:low-density lipoprotein receptor-related protein 5-like isoform X2 [Cylas formicarius]|uniref:low-density lipoprotein receptor-related protein 5-like isoform X2 n=1 Tax=Cylas formicarius TaxID=197179 RepID=UPI002958D05F|nr:low-density lipoprotein receptor-related protein 5-like isoform X2 [Cylas formicarius]
MILQPCNVELTKVHYYDTSKRNQNVSISTISREIAQNGFNRNVLIKKNIFGHRWVLRINELDDRLKKKPPGRKRTLYVVVFCFIVVAISSGIFFSLDRYIFKGNDDVIASTPKTVSLANFTVKIITSPSSSNSSDIDLRSNVPDQTRNATAEFCVDCDLAEEVCIKTAELEQPKCVRKRDKKDPTGCGGLCRIEVEYCKRLDKRSPVHQCLRLQHLLKCPANMFNCGNMCVSIDKRCDGKVDCSNKSDEKDCACDLETHFQCGNLTSCVDINKRCDGVVDCWDKTDEIGCDKVRCDDGHIPCLNGECIPKEKFCDKRIDCRDKSDEPKWCQ